MYIKVRGAGPAKAVAMCARTGESVEQMVFSSKVSS